MSETVVEQPTEIVEGRGGMVEMMNKQLMVAFINHHGRYDLDVRKSYVYYDEDGDFIFALANKLEGPGADEVFKRLNVKFWSKGIK